MQRRILSLVIFLLTLFLLLGIVDGSAVKAQHWTYEDGSNWLPDVDVGSTNEKCETCGHFYDPEEGHECWYECEYCHSRVSDLNKHYERSLACAIAAGYKEEDDRVCSICGLPKNECMCYQREDSNNSSNGNSYGDNETNVGTTIIGSIPKEASRNISVKELKYKRNVKLVSVLSLPLSLPVQTKTNECVVRAIALAAKMQGYDYDVAYNKCTELAMNAGYNLVSNGIPACQISETMQGYCDINISAFNLGNVEHYVDIGVSPMLISTELHAVVVLGYDNDYYYCAAGNPKGQVTIYQKNELSYDNIYTISKINTPYK